MACPTPAPDSHTALEPGPPGAVSNRALRLVCTLPAPTRTCYVIVAPGEWRRKVPNGCQAHAPRQAYTSRGHTTCRGGGRPKVHSGRGHLVFAWARFRGRRASGQRERGGRGPWISQRRLARESAASVRSPMRGPRLSAAGVETAARAGVTAAGALHHAATLLAGGAQVEALAPCREHRWIIGQRCRRRSRSRPARTSVAVCAFSRGCGGVPEVRAGGRLRGLAGPDCWREYPELLLEIDIEEARCQPPHDVVR